MIFDALLSKISHDIAIDLGTANTLVALKDYGVVIKEPSVVAVNKRNKQVLAVGTAAKKMVGRTPGSIVAVKPLHDGVISDFEATEVMIRYFIQKVGKDYGTWRTFGRPRVVIGVPSLITEVEVNAVIDAAKLAGARKVYIVEEPVAAAIGAGLHIEEASGCMVIDIGGGTSDIAILAMGDMVVDTTIKIAGNELDQSVISYLRNKYNMEIGESYAEEIKIRIGSAYLQKQEIDMQISGRDMISGLPKLIKVTSVEIREALMPVLLEIANAAKKALETAPPELIADLVRNGATIMGGGALLPGIDKFFSDKLKLKAKVADDPLAVVVKGASNLLADIGLLERIQIKDTAYSS